MKRYQLIYDNQPINDTHLSKETNQNSQIKTQIITNQYNHKGPKLTKDDL